MNLDESLDSSSAYWAPEPGQDCSRTREGHDLDGNNAIGAPGYVEGLLALLGVTREAGPLFVVAPAGSFTPLSTPTASGSPSDNDGAAFERCLRRGDRTAGVAVPLPCAQGVLRFRPALGAVADVHPGPVSRCQSRQSLSVMSVMSVVVSHVSRCQPVLKFARARRPRPEPVLPGLQPVVRDGAKQKSWSDRLIC